MPIAPPAIDGCTNRLVTISAPTISNGAPMRSTQGARLNKSHQSMMASPPSTPASNPMKNAWGRIAGSKNQPIHCSRTATMPGHKRSGFRGLGSAISVVAMVSLRAGTMVCSKFWREAGVIVGAALCGRPFFATTYSAKGGHGGPPYNHPRLLCVAEIDSAGLRIEVDRLRALFAHAETRFLRASERSLILDT